MRSIWSGAISFGLIYIPVRIYSAIESGTLDFDMLRRGDLCRIRYVRVCGETGEEVPYEEIVKGFEYEEGKYVVLEDHDFLRANPRKTKMIDIMNFVNVREIEPKYIEKPYFLEPDPQAKKVYALLRKALKESGKAAVACFVLRNREHLVLITPEGEALLLHILRFLAELRSPKDLELPKDQGVSKRELDMAIKLIDQLSEPWKPEQYHDTYIEDLKRIIQQKIQGKEEEPVEEEEPMPLEVTDLFARLRESLEMAQEKKR